MSKLTLLPLLIVTATAMLTWATARYMEMTHQQRALASTRPRSRPYATTLPETLIHR